MKDASIEDDVGKNDRDERGRSPSTSFPTVSSCFLLASSMTIFILLLLRANHR